MSDWVEGELAKCQMHDVRHTKRLARLFGRLSARPVSRIPTACYGWAETGAVSRFLDNPAIGVQEIVSGHTHATLERIRAQEVVLLVTRSGMCGQKCSRRMLWGHSPLHSPATLLSHLAR